MIVRVRIVAPKSKRVSFTVRLPLLVGRGAEAKFRIQHDQVSRRHCEFFAGDAAVYVRDLGSTNGTFIAGEQIPTSVRTPVPCGAMVRVGKVAFVVEYGQAEGTASAGERDDDTQTGSDPGGDRSAASGEESFAVDHPDDLPLPDGADGVEPPVNDPAAESDGDDPFAAVAAAFLRKGDAAAELPPEDSAPGQEPTAAEQAAEQDGEHNGDEPSPEAPAEEAAAAAEAAASPPKTDPESNEPGSAAEPDDEFLDFLKGLP